MMVYRCTMPCIMKSEWKEISLRLVLFCFLLFGRNWQESVGLILLFFPCPGSSQDTSQTVILLEVIIADHSYSSRVGVCAMYSFCCLDTLRTEKKKKETNKITTITLIHFDIIHQPSLFAKQWGGHSFLNEFQSAYLTSICQSVSLPTQPRQIYWQDQPSVTTMERACKNIKDPATFQIVLIPFSTLLYHSFP